MQSKRHESSCAAVANARIAIILAVVLAAIVCMNIPPAHAQTKLKGFTAGVPNSPMRIVKDTGDLDGDKIPDFVTAGTSKVFGLGVRAHSGATGKTLWDYELRGTLVPLSIATGDFNGDGASDILLGLYRWLRIGDEPAGAIIALSGKNGQVIFDIDSTSDESLIGTDLEVLDLYGSGVLSFLAVSREKNGDRVEAKISRYTYVEDALFLDCTYRTGSVESITDIHSVPDFDGDGARDVIFGMPDLANGALQKAGAVFLMSTNDCAVAETIKGPLAQGRLGSFFSAVPDLNGDGVEDIGFGWNKALLLHSGKDFSGLNKAIRPPVNLTLSGGIVALSDMTGDGVIDFGTIVVDPAQTQYRRALFLSGQDSTVIGNFSLQPFSTEADRSVVSRDVAGLLSEHMVDANNDGIKDPAFYVRSYFPHTNDPLDDDSPRAEITTITATCPRDVKIKFINTPEGQIVEAGTRPVFAKAVACGLDLPGTLTLTVGATTYEMYDSGKDGDEVAGDRTYTAMAQLSPGQNTLRIKANVTNTVPLVAEEAAVVNAVYNYDISIKNEFEWIEPVGHDKLNRDSWYGVTLAMPFAFSFYSREFEQMYVSNRGILLPSYPTNTGKGTAIYELEINKRLPTLEMSDPAIAVAWGLTAFYDKSTLYTKTLGSAGNQRFIVTFEGVQFQQSDSIKSRLDYQIIFHQATGKISVNYKIIYSQQEVDNHGLSLTMGLQAGSYLGATFSHKNAVVKNAISIEYIPGQSDGGNGGGDNGGGNGGGGGDNGGGNGGGGGDNGGDNGGGNGGGGDNGGGNTGGGGEDSGGNNNGDGGQNGDAGGNGGGDTGQASARYTLAFSFTQGRAGAKLVFDVRADSPAAQQALVDCRFSLLGGEGTVGVSARYRTVGTLSPGLGTRVVRLSRFRQALTTPKQARRRQPSKKIFLKGGVTCDKAGVSLESPPVQVETSKRPGALTAKQWLSRLASHLGS